ncbi:MAG TPA: lysine--tRNA ligase [Spirochaetaceae bacterium]|nr:lysine--tRNA ligase [Spirochaetaceae bacterium]
MPENANGKQKKDRPGENEISHWADRMAEAIVRRNPYKNVYTLASGITPSGTVHIGNFREIITTELVVRALRRKGYQVRFIYSWDDYDVFRKVPANMPKREILELYLRFPITDVPDTTGSNCSSYARRNELEIEDDLPAVGIRPEYIYQADRYKRSYYAKDIRFALQNKGRIIEILNKYREQPLDDSWWPISVFSSFSKKDTTTIVSYDGDWRITYRDDDTGEEETVDLRSTSLVKLNWRIDWPMRWAKEDVDFEPAGKDHHSSGGSFDTSKEIVEIFGKHAPLSLQYDFISIKGHGGKISSSSGDVVSLGDVLEIYTPEVTRYMFAKARPNTEFAISFDTDVFKIYEDYDNTEKIAFGITEASADKVAKERRIYELSQPGEIPQTPPLHVPFRHLCNLLLIHSCKVDEVLSLYPEADSSQLHRLRKKAICAVNWLRKYASEDYTWNLQSPDSPRPNLDRRENRAVMLIGKLGSEIDALSEQDLANRLYDIAEGLEVEPKALFSAAYTVLINRQKGPRLAAFLKCLGGERAAAILLRGASE